QHRPPPSNGSPIPTATGSGKTAAVLATCLEWLLASDSTAAILYSDFAFEEETMWQCQRMLTILAVLGILALPVEPSFAQSERPPLTALEQRVEFLTRHVNAEWGIYVKSLDTGEELALNADAAFDTMSVIKIPIMVEAFRQIEAGKFALSDRVAIQESDLRFGTGVLRSLDPGAQISVKDVIMLMNIVSDNTATDIM